MLKYLIQAAKVYTAAKRYRKANEKDCLSVEADAAYSKARAENQVLVDMRQKVMFA